jgi:hypothetical protein
MAARRVRDTQLAMSEESTASDKIELVYEWVDGVIARTTAYYDIRRGPCCRRTPS